MSIELQFKKGSLVMRAVLKDEAFLPLQKIVADHLSDEEVLSVPSQVVTTMPTVIGNQPPVTNGDTMAAAKAWLASHSAAEALNLIGWKTNPEKILILGAFHESKSSQADADWRSSDIQLRFDEARDQFPANFTRDISNAVKQNLIAPATYRTYRVSRTGWNKLAEVVATLANV
jgi:hypothetical protein